MDKHQKETELFEQYTDRASGGETKETIAKMLADDQELSAEYADFTLLTDGIKYSGRKKIVEKIKSWDKLMPAVSETEKGIVRLHPRWYYIAAAVSFFVIAAIAIYSSLNTGYDKVVAQYYQPYDYVSQSTRGEKESEKTLDNIYTSYDQGEYVKTIELINNLDKTQRNESTDFILANAYQATNKFDEAITLYEKTGNSESVYTYGAQWYMALCYLSMEKPLEAQAILEKLQNAKSSYAEKAKELLKEIQ